MRSVWIVFLALGVVLGAPPALAGGAGVLAGAWEGSFSCKTENDDGKGKLESGPSTLLISQSGSGPLVANLVAKGSGAYSGTIVPSAVKPDEGTGALIACGTSDSTATSLYNEIVTFHYKVGDAGFGTLKSTGVFVINAVQTAVCKGLWRRVSLLAKTAPCS